MFKTVDMAKVGLEVVANLKREIRKEFKEVMTADDFYLDVSFDPDGIGAIVIEHVDLMGPLSAQRDMNTLAMIAKTASNVTFMASGAQCPSFRDFKLGAMPAIWVGFKVTP